MTVQRIFGDVAVLGGLAAALALGQFAVRGDAFPWFADEPEAALCGVTDDDAGDSAGGARTASAPQFPRIEASAAVLLVGEPGVAFVDARGAHAYALGHVPGALCLPVGEAASILGRASLPLAPEDLVIAYCDSTACGDAEALSALLREHLGCRQVQVIAGGWDQWLAVGGPISGADEDEGGDHGQG
jgi:rhodanese-related sulfurtransferase